MTMLIMIGLLWERIVWRRLSTPLHSTCYLPYLPYLPHLPYLLCPTTYDLRPTTYDYDLRPTSYELRPTT